MNRIVSILMGVAFSLNITVLAYAESQEPLTDGKPQLVCSNATGDLRVTGEDVLDVETASATLSGSGPGYGQDGNTDVTVTWVSVREMKTAKDGSERQIYSIQFAAPGAGGENIVSDIIVCVQN